MNKSRWHQLALIPVYLIGIGTGLHGLAWLFAPEPWLLDKAANEILLRISYDQLFQAEVNQYLGDYLTGLYRFFGWWIFVIGLFILAYAFVTRFSTSRERNAFYLVMLITQVGLYGLQFRFIPTSPFLWTSHLLTLSLLVSFVASARLGRIENEQSTHL